MTTTTIRLPEELKERVARAAQHAGTTSHAFILHAIAESVEEAERRAEFNAAAEQRYARIIASGQTIPWREMRKHLEERIAGSNPPLPRARKLAP
jgi:predicted transcriptional regulator